MRANTTEPLHTADADLLAEFRSRRPGAAFNELVARHGAMVFRTCARLLRDAHAAEDATQAVFLALARQPQSVRGALPGWLHEVARRTSLKLLRTRRRRAVHEREASRMKSANESFWREELDAALATLPSLLREAIVLRYLEGRSQEEAARAAGCPQGTLAWRAMAGLDRLRTLLSRRGAAVTGAALVALLAGEAQAAVPPALLGTLKLTAVTTGACGAASVAQSVVKGLAWMKVKLSLMAAAAVAVVAVPITMLAASPEPPPGAPPRIAVAPSPPAADYNITLVTDRAPDFTNIESYLHSVTSQFATSQEKAINVWRWSQRLRKQTAWPDEGGHEVLDPILMFTSYGYTQCGIISGIDNSLWLNLGWKAHYVQLGDHTVCECSWDGGKTWHMFDNSMSIYCFNDKGEVAGVREIEKNPRYYLENFAPECGTNPVKGMQDHQGWRSGSDHPVEYNRSLANGMDSFLPPNDVIEDHLAARWGRSYAISLRPGESYTRHFSNLDAGKSDPHYFRPLRGKDPDQGGHRANGVWAYTPNLKIHPDIYADSGVTWTAQGPTGPGSVTFKVDAANIVTSAKVTLRGSGATASVSRDMGITWSPLGAEPDVAGTTQYLVRVDLAGEGSKLEEFSAETITQINRPALPQLTRGANRVQVRLGSQVDTIQFQPSIMNGNHKKTVFEEKSIEINEKPYFNVSTLRPASKGPCSATWKLETPTPIVDVVYGGNVTVKAAGDRASLLHSWDGKSFTEDFRKTDGALPYDLVVNAAAGRVPDDQKQVFLRYEFETLSDGEKWRAPGIQTALMTVHHKPRRAGFSPIEVTYCWIEHRPEGDVERKHTEIVASPEHEYTVNVAGFKDPTMKWVRMNLADGAKPGYSDGKDVGSGATPLRAKYTWGANLAKGKPYMLEGKQSDKNPDGGNDLTDGIIAPPEEYVSVKYMPTNVIFQQDVSPVATIDLGAAQSIAAVRVHAGQEGGFHLAYPDTITVEVSTDGKTFAKAGAAAHNQVFDPPADHADWEQKDAPKYDALPAGGRLAYGYRIILEKPVPARYVRVTCACRKGWGLMLSEIQVFDKVEVDTKVPPSVVLPPLSPKRR
jgi:RNA polymerase sigma factor (sigma-70 family)